MNYIDYKMTQCNWCDEYNEIVLESCWECATDNVCINCQENCWCGSERFCERCVKTCSICGCNMCPDCMINNKYCPDCHYK